MKKTLKITKYILIWSILICILIIGLRYLKVELNGEGKRFWIELYIVIGGLYSACAVVPTFLFVDYFIYIPKIKEKIILNGIRILTLLLLIGVVGIIEHFFSKYSKKSNYRYVHFRTKQRLVVVFNRFVVQTNCKLASGCL